MMENKSISAELLAAYMEGNTTSSESRRVFDALEDDMDLRELMRISQAVDDDLGMYTPDMECLPLTAMAASCGEENYCCLECEKFILTARGVSFDERRLLATALQNKWQEEKGTSLSNIGRHLENHGFSVSRHYQCSIQDIREALAAGSDIIAVVDGGELTGDRIQEVREDVLFGPIPDHSVVVLSCDDATVRIFDPDSPNPEDTYPISQFRDAWADSKNYLVIINQSKCPK